MPSFKLFFSLSANHWIEKKIRWSGWKSWKFKIQFILRYGWIVFFCNCIHNRASTFYHPSNLCVAEFPVEIKSHRKAWIFMLSHPQNEQKKPLGIMIYLWEGFISGTFGSSMELLRFILLQRIRKNFRLHKILRV